MISLASRIFPRGPGRALRGRQGAVQGVLSRGGAGLGDWNCAVAATA
jgi:hypothetical protein